MNELLGNNITNANFDTSPSNYCLQGRNNGLNDKRSITPIIIERKSRKSNINLTKKKLTKQGLPKYMGKSKYPLEKQNLLESIETENKKLLQQNFINKKLTLQLEKKKLNNLGFSQLKPEIENKISKVSGMGRVITSASQALAEQKNSYLLQTINNQISKLVLESKENEEKINALKKSAKYARYFQNKSSKTSLLTQLQSLKYNNKRLEGEIRGKKRIQKENRRRKIALLLMQGQMEDTIQAQNIGLYHQIEQLNCHVRSKIQKKKQFMKKKQQMLKQILNFAKTYAISETVVDEFFSSYGKNNLIQSELSLHLEKLYDKNPSKKNTLESLKEQEFGQDGQAIKVMNNNKKEFTKCFQGKVTNKDCLNEIKQNDSSIQSEVGQFLHQEIPDKFRDKEDLRRNKEEMDQIEKKYFGGEDEPNSQTNKDKYISEMCEDSYNFSDEQDQSHEKFQNKLKQPIMTGQKMRMVKNIIAKGSQEDPFSQKTANKEKNNYSNKQKNKQRTASV